MDSGIKGGPHSVSLDNIIYMTVFLITDSQHVHSGQTGPVVPVCCKYYDHTDSHYKFWTFVKLSVSTRFELRLMY